MDKKNEQNVNNLSVGEIQLVYLARAEIRNSKLLLWMKQLLILILKLKLKFKKLYNMF